jgi:prolipoprotein diacylglyceryltransferase
MQLLEPHPVLTQTAVGPITAHGVAFALGAFVGLLVLGALTREVKSWRYVEVIERGLIIFLVGLVAARLGFWLVYLGSVAVGEVLQIWRGGLLSFAGLVGGGLATILLGRRLSPNERRVWRRAVVVATLVAWAIGRLGNYYGADSGGVLAAGWELTSGRVPIQLFESLWCLLLAIALIKAPVHLVPFLGVGGYGLARVVIDTWRDERIWAGWHLSQWVGMGMILFALIAYVARRPRPHS